MSVRVPALQGVKGLPIVQVQKVHIYLPVLQDMNRKAPDGSGNAGGSGIGFAF